MPAEAKRLCMNSHRTGFDWNDLRSFLAVVRTGRLTAAASQLGIDHSTLSRRIASLEDALQVRLFDRLSTGYVLTEAGESLIGHAEKIETAAIRISSTLLDAKASMAGPVRIATPEGFGTYFIAHRLQDLSERHPDVSLELIADPNVVSLSKRQADIAVTMLRPEAGPLRARKLTDYEYGLYGAEDLLCRRPGIETMRDLRDVKLIGYMPDLLPTAAHDYLQEYIGDRPADLQVSNIITQLSATLRGYGVCILPCFMALKHKGLVRILSKDIRFTRSYWLVAHMDSRGPARTKAVSTSIIDLVNENRRSFLPSFV